MSCRLNRAKLMDQKLHMQIWPRLRTAFSRSPKTPTTKAHGSRTAKNFNSQKYPTEEYIFEIYLKKEQKLNEKF